MPDAASRFRRLGDVVARPGAQLAMLVGAAAIAHVAVHLAARASPYLAFRVGDETYYHDWARAIAGGALSRDTAFFTSPLFAYALAALYRIAGDSIGAVQALNLVLGVGAVALTWAATSRLAGRGPALLAGALVAFTRCGPFQESVPDKTTLILFLTALALHAVAWADERPTAARWAVAGAAAGVAALAHGLLLTLVAAALVHLLARWRTAGPRDTVRRAAALAAGAALAIAPATIHNALRSGQLVLISSNGGQNLYSGNHAGNLTGTYTSTPFARPHMYSEENDFRAEAERRTGRRMGPADASRFWSAQAIAEMRALPELTARRFLRKLRWAFAAEDLADTRTYAFYVAEIPALRFMPWDFGLVAALGLLGAALSLRDRTRVVLVAFVALLAVGLAIFFVLGRLRFPMLVPLAILAATVPGRISALLAARRQAALGAVAALMGFAAWFVFGEVLPGLETSFFPDYYNQGNRYAAAGRVDLALAEYEKAVSVRPGDHPAMSRVAAELADVHLERGDPASARRVIAAALRARPGDPLLSAKLAALAGR